MKLSLTKYSATANTPQQINNNDNSNLVNYEENNGDLSDDEFLQMFKDVCVDYNFLYINYQNDSKHRYENCFEEFI